MVEKIRKSTGYTIREDYDLNSLKKYGFYKPEPDTCPWWQRPFNIVWGLFGTWDTELLVNRNDRKLLMEVKEGSNTDDLQETLNEMINDGVFE